MRMFPILTFCLLVACCSAFGHKDRASAARTVSLTFDAGEKVTFELADQRVSKITLQIGNSIYSVPTNICGRLRDIRFDTVRLVWNGLHKSAAEADYFHLLLHMGPPRPGLHPEFPPVQLMFRDGKFQKALGIDLP